MNFTANSDGKKKKRNFKHLQSLKRGKKLKNKGLVYIFIIWQFNQPVVKSHGKLNPNYQKYI